MAGRFRKVPLETLAPRLSPAECFFFDVLCDRRQGGFALKCIF